MKQLKQLRSRWLTIISRIFLSLVCLTATTIAVAQDKKPGAKIVGPGSFVLTVTDRRVSLEANDASLAKIFKELGQKAGIEVDLQTGSEQKISIKLDRAPLEDAVNRLSDNVAVFYAKDPKEQNYRIAKIAVLLKGRESSGGLQVVKNPTPEATTSITVAKVSAPPETVKPEPFKFEFDPGKFTEKEKPRNQR